MTDEEKQARIDQLKGQRSMTDAEFREYVVLLGPGGTKKAGNVATLGQADSDVVRENVEILKSSLVFAAENRLWLQAISCTAYLLEMEMRPWMVEVAGRTFDPDERLTFGQFIREAERFGFDSDLIQRLLKFSSTRNDAIHHLVRGKLRYWDLEPILDADRTLHEDVRAWVYAALPDAYDHSAGRWNY